MSLDISFSGLLSHMLAYFTENVVFVPLKLIDRPVRASNMFETQDPDSMLFLHGILPGKKMELASSEMELDSSRNKFPEFKNFKAASSSKHSNHSRLITDVTPGSIQRQEHLFSRYRNEIEGASSSEEALIKSGMIISHPSSFCKGKVILQASEAEQLSTRLKILEEENEIMKQALLETVVERKRLVNEIYELFQTLRYSLHCQHQEEDEHRSCYGSLIIKPGSDITNT